MSKFAPTINRATQTITVIRAFQIVAGNIGSAEYQEFLWMKEQYATAKLFSSMPLLFQHSGGILVFVIVCKKETFTFLQIRTIWRMNA